MHLRRLCGALNCCPALAINHLLLLLPSWLLREVPQLPMSEIDPAFVATSLDVMLDEDVGDMFPMVDLITALHNRSQHIDPVVLNSIRKHSCSMQVRLLSFVCFLSRLPS